MSVDEAMFRTVYEEQAERLINFLVRLVGRGVAEEVGGEVWMQFFVSWQDKPEHPNPTALLYMIARCRAVSHLRQAMRTVPVEDECLEALAGTMCSRDRGIEAAELRLDLKQALAGLPERERQAVYLHHVDGLSEADTAAVLGLKIDNVKRILKKARRALRQSPSIGSNENPER